MRSLAVVLSLAAACAGCSAATSPVDASVGEAPARAIHVVNHGWHTGIVVRRSDIPQGLIAETADFPHAESIEVGWGDRAYYPADAPGIGLALQAVLWPTPGVLHLVGFRGPVERQFGHSGIIEIALTDARLARLVRRIDASFDRTPGERAASIGRGLYGDSRFYPSNERFHLFRMCNTWVAEALAEAGLPVNPSAAMTAGGLMEQLSAIGRPIQALPAGRAVRRGATQPSRPASHAQIAGQ